jgi:hypothetical protein
MLTQSERIWGQPLIKFNEEMLNYIRRTIIPVRDRMVTTMTILYPEVDYDDYEKLNGISAYDSRLNSAEIFSKYSSSLLWRIYELERYTNCLKSINCITTRPFNIRHSYGNIRHDYKDMHKRYNMDIKHISWIGYKTPRVKTFAKESKNLLLTLEEEIKKSVEVSNK